MRNSLDFDNNVFKSLLDKSTDLIIKEYGALDNQIGYHDISQKEVESWFNEKVPINGMSADEVLKIVKEKIYGISQDFSLNILVSTYDHL